MSTFNSASPTSSISPSSNNPGLSNNSNQAPSESVLSNFSTRQIIQILRLKTNQSSYNFEKAQKKASNKHQSL